MFSVRISFSFRNPLEVRTLCRRLTETLCCAVKRRTANQQFSGAGFYEMQLAPLHSSINSPRRHLTKLGCIFRRDHQNGARALLAPELEWLPGGADDRQLLGFDSNNGSFSEP